MGADPVPFLFGASAVLSQDESMMYVFGGSSDTGTIFNTFFNNLFSFRFEDKVTYSSIYLSIPIDQDININQTINRYHCFLSIDNA